MQGVLCQEDLMETANTSLRGEYVGMLAKKAGATLKVKVGGFTLTDEQIRLFTDLNYDELSSLAALPTSMRNVEGRSILQALVIFLFKMRSGNWNAMVAAVFGLEHPQRISDVVDSIIRSFENDVPPFRLGFSAHTRAYLIENETSGFVRPLFGASNGLALMYDGTYVRHGKCVNEKKSYSGQIKTHLALHSMYDDRLCH